MCLSLPVSLGTSVWSHSEWQFSWVQNCLLNLNSPWPVLCTIIFWLLFFLNKTYFLGLICCSFVGSKSSPPGGFYYSYLWCSVTSLHCIRYVFISISEVQDLGAFLLWGLLSLFILLSSPNVMILPISTSSVMFFSICLFFFFLRVLFFHYGFYSFYPYSNFRCS